MRCDYIPGQVFHEIGRSTVQPNWFAPDPGRKIQKRIGPTGRPGRLSKQPMEERERFWSEYYRRLVDGGEELDYSNDKVQAQTFGFALASAGPLGGLQCLDFACGAGRFARVLAAFGAHVTGVDLIPE